MPKLKYHFFLSYSDKNEAKIVTPLRDKLQEEGYNIWDRHTKVKLGDSFLNSINQALSLSQYGLVILSKEYLDDPALLNELNSLISQEQRLARKVLLPILHNIDTATLAQDYPLLLDRKTINTDLGISHLKEQIIEGIDKPSENWLFEGDQNEHGLKQQKEVNKHRNGRFILLFLIGIILLSSIYLSSVFQLPSNHPIEVIDSLTHSKIPQYSNSSQKPNTATNKPLGIAGQIVDNNYRGIEGVKIFTQHGRVQTYTDSLGFFKLKIPGEKGQRIHIFLSKEAYISEDYFFYLPAENIQEVLLRSEKR